jgi:hypothetical protein
MGKKDIRQYLKEQVCPLQGFQWSGAFGDILVAKFVAEHGVDAMKLKAAPGSDPPTGKPTEKVDFNGFRESFVQHPQ